MDLRGRRPRDPPAPEGGGTVFSDGAPLTAARVKGSFERSIRLSKDQMPAAFVAIRGVSAFAEGKADSVEGIAAPSEREIVIRLSDPLPIFASLLTDPRTAIVATPSRRLGRLSAPDPSGSSLHAPERVVLERNPRHASEAARVDRIEFRASLAASAIADGLRSGDSLDIVRDLLPQDLESILREPRFRAGLVETPKKNTYFAVFHTGQRRGIERRPSNGAGQRRSNSGPRLGHPRTLRAARDGPDSSGNPRPRRRPAADALPREKAAE